MEQVKRQASNSFSNYYNHKRQKIQVTTDETTILSTKIISQFEDLSNELIYDIFEFLDYFHSYQVFSNLNLRFHHLLHNSNVPIKINFSNVSKSAFKCYNNDIIKPNTHRISSLHFSGVFSYDFIITSISKLSKFTRLETLVLHNIEFERLKNVLNELSSVPILSSLIISTMKKKKDHTNIVCPTSRSIFSQIFRLPALKYCKVSFAGFYEEISLPAATNQYSSIEHLVITNRINLRGVSSLLSYVPHLRCLSLESQSTSSHPSSQIFPCLLNYLTYVSLNMYATRFNELEHLIINTFHSVEVFRLTLYSYSDLEYIDAKRWEQLIVFRLPKLRIFDIQLDISFGNENDQLAIQTKINHFTSPFWIERQWFFAYHFSKKIFGKRLLFHSTNPYRRKRYTLYKQEDQDVGFHHHESNLNSVQQVHLDGEESAINCTKYFPNATELILQDEFSAEHLSITTNINRIIPLKRLTKLFINCYSFSIPNLIEILCCSPNIHTLELQWIAWDRRNNALTSIKQSKPFQEVSNTNNITNITCEAKPTLEDIKLLVALCPQVQYLSIKASVDDLESIIRFLLDKTNSNTRHLHTFNFPKVFNNRLRKLKTFIESEALLDDYILKSIDQKLFLWW